MKCRQCGTEIAEKALICYRCGTAVSEPVFKPPAQARSTRRVALTVILMASGALAAVLSALTMSC